MKNGEHKIMPTLLQLQNLVITRRRGERGEIQKDMSNTALSNLVKCYFMKHIDLTPRSLRLRVINCR